MCLRRARRETVNQTLSGQASSSAQHRRGDHVNILLFSAATRASVIVALAWGMAACSPGESYTGSSPPAPSPKPASAAAESALIVAGVKLQSEPAVLEQCGASRGKRAAVKVSWDATTARVNTVKIWVQDADKGPRLAQREAR
jgi:hypothetical protein